MRTRHESIQVVVSFFGLSSGSNAELPPLGSRQVEMPMPASLPACARRIAAGHQRRVVDRRQRLVEHGVVVAGVVGRAARDRVGKLVLADQVLLPQRDPVHVQELRHAIHGAFEREIGRRLAEAAHRFLRRLVGHHRDRLVADRADAIGTADRAHRLAELERRAAGIGADIVDGADLAARGWCRRRRRPRSCRRCGRDRACRRRACFPGGPRSGAPARRGALPGSRPARCA